MDAPNNATFGVRRKEDIALDLMKFVAGTAGVGRPAVAATGFSGSAGPKPDENITQLLDLYRRCLRAVEGGAGEKEAAR